MDVSESFERACCSCVRERSVQNLGRIMVCQWVTSRTCEVYSAYAISSSSRASSSSFRAASSDSRASLSCSACLSSEMALCDSASSYGGKRQMSNRNDSNVIVCTCPQNFLLQFLFIRPSRSDSIPALPHFTFKRKIPISFAFRFLQFPLEVFD